MAQDTTPPLDRPSKLAPFRYFPGCQYLPIDTHTYISTESYWSTKPSQCQPCGHQPINTLLVVKPAAREEPAQPDSTPTPIPDFLPGGRAPLSFLPPPAAATIAVLLSFHAASHGMTGQAALDRARGVQRTQPGTSGGGHSPNV